MKPARTNIVDANGVITNNSAEIALWIDKDESASIAISGTLEVKWQNSLINCQTSHEMWKRLAAQHEQTAEEFQYHLLQSFFDYKYQKSHNVMDHITAIETLAAQLADIGSPLSEQDVITKIICTLPPSLRPVRSAWKNVDPSKRNLQLLTTRLLEEESYDRNTKVPPLTQPSLPIKMAAHHHRQPRRGEEM